MYGEYDTGELKREIDNLKRQVDDLEYEIRRVKDDLENEMELEEMVEIKIEMYGKNRKFIAKTKVDIYPENDIVGIGNDPYDALEQWLYQMQEREYFRPD